MTPVSCGGRRHSGLSCCGSVRMKPAREGQDEGHDARADMVVVDFSELRRDRSVRDRLRVVPAGGRRRPGRLDPAEPRSLPQEGGRRVPKAASARPTACDLCPIIGDDDGRLRQRGGEALRPFAHGRSLRRQHEGSHGHRASTYARSTVPVDLPRPGRPCLDLPNRGTSRMTGPALSVSGESQRRCRDRGYFGSTCLPVRPL